MTRVRLWLLISTAAIFTATVSGGWLGWRGAKLEPGSPHEMLSAASAIKAEGPIIVFPLENEPQSTPDVVAPMASSQELKTTDPEIVPGGVVLGQAVERMWETTANLAWQVRPAPLTPPNWFITGVVKRGDQSQIIVQFDGEPAPRFMKIGDLLPGGGRLAWVRSDAIGVVMPGRKSLGVPVLSGQLPKP